MVEIRSPGDESYDKLPFFAKLGVREVVIIERDTKLIEVFVLAGGVYQPRRPDAEGALTVEALGVRLAVAPGPRPRLRVSDAADPSAAALI